MQILYLKNYMLTARFLEKYYPVVQISDEWNIRHLSFIHMWRKALLFNII